MVRLLPPPSGHRVEVWLSFNPTMVRLLQGDGVAEDVHRWMFQSHYGAIATRKRHCHRTITASMVSIPLWCDCYVQTQCVGNLHRGVSIPLWCDCYLKDVFHKPSGYLVFQSHYGAIATLPTLSNVLTLWRFQSHYGAIATTSPDCTPPPRGGFNPTMVRLLRGQCAARSCPEHGFNPTMVRLLPPMVGKQTRASHQFQSHYGAIATGVLIPDIIGDVLFQSHYGAIATSLGGHHVRQGK